LKEKYARTERMEETPKTPKKSEGLRSRREKTFLGKEDGEKSSWAHVGPKTRSGRSEHKTNNKMLKNSQRIVQKVGKRKKQKKILREKRGERNQTTSPTSEEGDT